MARRPQIPLDLAPEPAFTFESFIAAPSNAEALGLLKAWPQWPAPAMLLVGPEASGKTHLGEAWLARSHSVFLDDAHTRTEEALFGFINRSLRGEIPGLLLASRVPPGDWGVQMPDLRSRLSAMPKLVLHEPDDESLRPIARALFERRGRVVPEDVVDYLMRHAPRDVPELRRTIGEIDDAAQAARADVTKAFVAKVLRENLDLFD